MSMNDGMAQIPNKHLMTMLATLMLNKRLRNRGHQQPVGAITTPYPMAPRTHPPAPATTLPINQPQSGPPMPGMSGIILPPHLGGAPASAMHGLMINAAPRTPVARPNRMAELARMQLGLR